MPLTEPNAAAGEGPVCRRSGIMRFEEPEHRSQGGASIKYIDRAATMQFRSRLSPSVYLVGGCAWVKLALYVPSIYV